MRIDKRRFWIYYIVIMGKNKVYKLLLFLFVLVCVVGLCVGCGRIKTALDDEDYVEVTGLRIDGADIYMAPIGENSTYQLEIEIIPFNATNRKLNYYIPSEYLQYVSVSGSGLLTAHENTGDIVVPLTVTSTTNSDAKLIISIVVEEIGVKKIEFTKEKLNFWYQSEPQQVSMRFYPSHAVDGRTVTYTSLNEEVATVVKDSETGDAIVSPGRAGQTHIKAVSSTMDGKNYEAYLPVYVEYMAAQYQLVYSGSPRWTQVVGDFSPINFTLYVLGDHIDPNPEIEWYIGNERVARMSDRISYSHTPTSTTQISYKIGVFVRGYKQEGTWLYSDTITIFNKFVGFDLEYENLNSVYNEDRNEAYQYGDEAEFSLVESSSGNTASYDWFLQKMDGDGTELFLANTSVDDRNLKNKRINVVGDYQLMAKAKNRDGNYLGQKRFTFSSVKLVKGDVLVVKPNMISGGLPPDSYHWYLLECDEDGNYNVENKVWIKDTAKGETLYYPLKESGYFRVLVTATTNGIMTTIDGENGKVEYVNEGILLRVYDGGELLEEEEGDLVDVTQPEAHGFATSSISRISGVVIEGCAYSGEFLLYLHWTPTIGVDRYIVEFAFKDGTVKMVDSVEQGAYFGTNFFRVPSDIATFSDVFTVRIKQKDGLFSDYYYYGTENENGQEDAHHYRNIGEDKFPYFSDITDNVNGYVTTTDEMYALVEYILLFQPTHNALARKGNVTIDNQLYDTYTVKFYSPLATEEMMNTFDVTDIPNEIVDSDLLYMYILMRGVQQQGPYLCDFQLSLTGDGNGIYTAVFSLLNKTKRDGFKATNDKTQNPTVVSAFQATYNYAEKPNGTSMSYPVDKKQGVHVSTSNQLCYVMEQGYCPVPVSSDNLAELYKQVKYTYSSLVGMETSDLNKILVFYDWLCYNVAYDEETELSTTMSELEKYMIESSQLEGIFSNINVNTNNRHARSAGYAKAFSVLCGLAGIPCRTIALTVGNYHVYNKVYVNDAWYVVDVAFGVTRVDEDTVYADHAWCLITDNQYSSLCQFRKGEAAEILGAHPAADKRMDIYQDLKLTMPDPSDTSASPKPVYRSIFVRTEEELLSLLRSIALKGTVALEVECAEDLFGAFADFNDYVGDANLTLGTGKYVGEIINSAGTGDNVRAVVLLYDNG